MAPSRSTLLVAAALLLASCGGGDEGSSSSPDGDESTTTTTETTTVAEEEVESGDVDSREVELAEVGDSGISGTVELSAVDEGELSLAVELDEGHEDVHGLEARKGSCDDVADPGAVDSVLGEVATYTLPDVEDGSMEGEATLPEDVVSEGTYALVVYEGEGVDGDAAACAEVEIE